MPSTSIFSDFCFNSFNLLISRSSLGCYISKTFLYSSISHRSALIVSTVHLSYSLYNSIITGFTASPPYFQPIRIISKTSSERIHTCLYMLQLFNSPLICHSVGNGCPRSHSSRTFQFFPLSILILHHFYITLQFLLSRLT